MVILASCGGQTKREAAAPVRPAPSQTPQVTNTSPVPRPIESAGTKAPAAEPVARDLAGISADKTLRVLFTFNSTGYFIYRGETMGYEYELLKMFARDSGLRLEPVVERDSNKLFNLLNEGNGDLVAAQLAATTNQSEVLMTDALYSTAPVVVQRNGLDPAAGMPPAVSTALDRQEKRDAAPETVEIHARPVVTPGDLAGRRVQIPRVSPYRGKLIELNDQLTRDVEIVEVDESSDRLIQRLSEGEIDLTVAAENLASLKAGEYRNLVVKPLIGPPQPIVWAVRLTSPQLRDALNRWLTVKRKSGLLAILYRKYFLDRRGFAVRASSQFLTAETGTLSAYDDWFREYANIPGWDWRLVAAQAYQESRFNPAARSWAGAAGLMQIMPATAKQMHVNASDPRQSIEGACRYLWQFDKLWKETISNEDERIKFILASYNVGAGHVQDAVRLAEKHGDNPKSWRDVGYWLIQKSKRSVYNDPVVKHGYARGTEPVAYVDEILSRWKNYSEFVPDVPATTPGAEPAGTTPAPAPQPR
jgi:membrane-bound lytic murein transglycosylase F